MIETTPNEVKEGRGQAVLVDERLKTLKLES